MKVINNTTFPVIVFSTETRLGYSEDVTIQSGKSRDVSGPYVGEMGSGDCYIHLAGEVTCHEGPDDNKGFQVVRGAPLSLLVGDRGVVVRHYLDELEPRVAAWREQHFQWKLLGYDTFSGEDYSLAGAYISQRSAEQAAEAQLKELQQTQPDSETGGQDEQGIQDRVFVVRPDGTKYRYTGNPTPVGSQ